MYRKKAEGWLKHIDFILLEQLCFQAAFLLGFMLRHGVKSPYQSLLYRNTAMVSGVFLVIVLTCTNTFSGVLWRGYYVEFVSTVKTVFAVMFAVILYLFGIQQGGFFSRILFLAWGFFYVGLSYLIRSLWKYYLKTKRNVKRNLRSMIIITTMAEAEMLVTGIREEFSRDYEMTGIILQDRGDFTDVVLGVPVITDLDHAEEYLCHHWVDEVLLTLSEDEPRRQKLIELLMDMGIVVHQKLGKEGDFFGKQSYVQKIGGFPVLTMSVRILTVGERVSKRTLDICGSLIGCLCAIVLFLVIGPVIYFSSPGPVIFSQERVGRNGKKFLCYKFRSMYPDAEARKAELYEKNEIGDGMMFKVTDDPRIIGSGKGAGKGIGHFIRRTSIDEFPQFFNVLKGDMSLVGTRPPTLDEWERYESRHRSRLAIKPGITGLWQVSGRSDIQNFDEVLRMDHEYIENWNLGMDIKILLRTLVVVLRKQGAK